MASGPLPPSRTVHLDTIKDFIYHPMHNRIALKEY